MPNSRFAALIHPLFNRPGAVAAALAAVLLSLNAPAFAQSEPPKKIDIGSLSAATLVDEVVVPVPSEVFSVLDKLGSPNWHEILRSDKTNTPRERTQQALLLGTVIAEGFIAVEAQDSQEVKKIGNNVLKLAAAIGVERHVKARSSAIIESANDKDWNKVRRELDGALQDVKAAMIELEDEQLAQLVSLGGWLRGTEALTAIVRKSYTRDSAELLNQPALLDFFERRLNGLDSKLRSDPLVAKIHTSLPKIRPHLGDGQADIGPKAVEEIHTITSDLVKLVNARES